MTTSAEPAYVDEWSDDGRTLTIRYPHPEGVLAATIRWNHDPTPEQIAEAHKKSSDFTLEVGETQRAHRWGPFVVSVNTGPPTWWWPRAKITGRAGRRKLGAGWLRVAATISRAPRSAS